MPHYKDPRDRHVSHDYRELLHAIQHTGQRVDTRQGVPALTMMQGVMSFPLADGFPMITDRDMTGFWRKPIAELCAFINGATTIAELEAFGCNWWGPWATEDKTQKLGLPPGELGPGSYGGAFKHFPTGGISPKLGMDQFKHLVEQIRELPELRTHFVTPWIPQYQMRGEEKQTHATIAPCHGWVHVRVLNGGLHLHMYQRSGDVPVGVPSNMIQYGALMLMLEHLTGYTADTYYHTISDAHIYADQMEAVEKMLTRTPRALPTVTLNDAGRQVTDIHGFRAEHFDLDHYYPHPALRVPVSV